MLLLQIDNTAVYNHAISAKKFRIIESILKLGWNVLLSDIDVLVLKARDARKWQAVFSVYPCFSHSPYAANLCL